MSSGRKSNSREKKAASKASTAVKLPEAAYQLAKTAIAAFELQSADKTLVASLVEYVRTVDAGLTKNALYNEALIAIAVYFLRYVAPVKYRRIEMESLDAVQLHGYIRLALLHFCSANNDCSDVFRQSIFIPPEVTPIKKQQVAFRAGSGHFCVAEYCKFYVIVQDGDVPGNEGAVPVSDVDSLANAFADYFLCRVGLSEHIYDANKLAMSYADFMGLDNRVEEDATSQVLPGYKEVTPKPLSLKMSKRIALAHKFEEGIWQALDTLTTKHKMAEDVHLSIFFRKTFGSKYSFPRWIQT